MVERTLFGPGGATEVKQDTTIDALVTILTELQGKFEAGQAVALDAPTLSAVIDSGEREYVHAVATVTAPGPTTILTPTAGNRLRLRWFYAVQNPSAGVSPLIRVLLGPTEVYRAWALSKRQVVTGPVDGSLVVDLSVAGEVAVTTIYEEV